MLSFVESENLIQGMAQQNTVKYDIDRASGQFDHKPKRRKISLSEP